AAVLGQRDTRAGQVQHVGDPQCEIVEHRVDVVGAHQGADELRQRLDEQLMVVHAGSASRSITRPYDCGPSPRGSPSATFVTRGCGHRLDGSMSREGNGLVTDVCESTPGP